MTNHPTPLQSIHLRCVDCGETAHDVKRCEFDDCVLFPFKMGKGRAKLGHIRKFCVDDCMNGSRHEVENCPTESCPLHFYRLGTNPNSKGGRKPNSGSYQKGRCASGEAS
jgi:hypothetical protein